MEGLDAALERARHVYAEEREMIRPDPNGTMIGVKTDASGKRDRLRKNSLARMVSGRATEMLEELDWWGIPRPRDLAEAERARREVLEGLAQEPGAPGNSALRAAGFTLLGWWVEQGNAVTATLETDTAKDSYTVEFLSAQLPLIDKRLDEDGARQSAYFIARAWLAQPTPHWTELAPHLPANPAGFAK